MVLNLRGSDSVGTEQSSSNSNLKVLNEEDLLERLKANLEVKDRTWRTKTYKNCFLHSEAIDFVMKYHQNSSEESAVQALNDLRIRGYLQHVVDPHKPFKMNQNKRKLYFCFMDDESCHIKQKQKDDTEKFMRQNKLTPQVLQEVIRGTDEFAIIESKLRRMETLMEKMNKTASSNDAKLEILHQATISLIETTVVNAFVLLIVFLYTLYVILPSLHQSRLTQLITSLSGTILIGAFVVKGMDLFSVWLQLDSSVIQAAEGDTASEDDDDDASMEMTLGKNDILSKSPGSRRVALQKRQSSVFVRDGLLSKSMYISNKCVAVRQRPATDIPRPSEWPHRPLLVCANTPTDPSLKVHDYGNGPCPIGKPFAFSSDLFEGQCLIRLKHIPRSDAPDQDAAYFSGRRRLFQMVVQGRFKREIGVHQVLTGHEFVKPLQKLPHPWILKAATNFIGKLSPGAEIRVVGNQPTMLASLAATSQVLRGDEPGNEPDITSTDDFEEDCTCFGGKFSRSSKVSSSGRKLHLSNPTRSAKYTFDTETVYTFDFYQSLLNCATYALDLGVANIRMVPVLNGQPIQALAKTTDGQYLWSFQIWHEDLLPPNLASQSKSEEEASKDKDWQRKKKH